MRLALLHLLFSPLPPFEYNLVIVSNPTLSSHDSNHQTVQCLLFKSHRNRNTVSVWSVLSCHLTFIYKGYSHLDKIYFASETCSSLPTLLINLCGGRVNVLGDTFSRTALRGDWVTSKVSHKSTSLLLACIENHGSEKGLNRCIWMERSG